MHTEKEAEKLWCPMARIGHRDGITMNDPSAPDELQGRCIGSRCAMWRWHGRADGNVISTTNGHIPRAEAVGYCGLAGTPVIRP